MANGSSLPRMWTVRRFAIFVSLGGGFLNELAYRASGYMTFGIRTRAWRLRQAFRCKQSAQFSATEAPPRQPSTPISLRILYASPPTGWEIGSVRRLKAGLRSR